MALTPSTDDLDDVVRALVSWQSDELPLQLHPGDVGWFHRFGADPTAAALRVWRRDDRVLAVGLLDGPVLRLTTAPDVSGDAMLARQIRDDVTDPARGVLPAGRVAVEAPTGALVHELLSDAGWLADEPWSPLSRDLTEPVIAPALRVEEPGAEQADAWAEVVRASFGSSADALERLRATASDSWLADSRCLLGYDDDGHAVAAITVWSAGTGRPGLIEPMGVHPDHRGHGHGTAICVAAAAALRESGSSSAQVCTATSNTGGVATYVAAGFEPLPLRYDRYRPPRSPAEWSIAPSSGRGISDHSRCRSTTRRGWVGAVRQDVSS